eukprot:1426266-Amphidinium_carterae.1
MEALGYTVCQEVRHFWLKLRIRLENWPRVRLPVLVEVVPVMETNLPAAPFEVGPHRRVVEHATYAMCLDCNRHMGVPTGRKNINYHLLKLEGSSLPDPPTKKGAKLEPGFSAAPSAATGLEDLPSGIG